ncbi:hypothetical protein B0J11DRAFT_14473 [Dendryphion nanum]|uniref:Uncharacterized protein n=1 Tax=Dendryphion nanum TaxID=256645 RepID=A0A9P9J174_9PLEO|nr:hypothetical protein B0J11DRAFT_14473 [Dendryphion nanum]
MASEYVSNPALPPSASASRTHAPTAVTATATTFPNPGLHPHSSIPTQPCPLPGTGEQDTAKYVVDNNNNRGQHSDKQLYHGHGDTDALSPKRHRIIYGLALPVFILVVVLVACVAVVAIAGGVSAGTAAKGRRECRQELGAMRERVRSGGTGTAITASPTATATGRAGQGGPGGEEGTIVVPRTKCPDTNGTLYTASFAQKNITFRRFCNTVIDRGDMFQISAPSWSACMDACAQYIDFFGTLETKGSTPTCAGISYVPEWSLYPEYAMGNYSTRGSCWIKSRVDGGMKVGAGWHLPAEVVSSVRVD